MGATTNNALSAHIVSTHHYTLQIIAQCALLKNLRKMVAYQSVTKESLLEFYSL